MDAVRPGRPLQRVELNRSISNFTINQPASAPFSQLASVTRSRSESRINDYREVIREKFRVTPYLYKYYQSKEFDNDYWWDRYSVGPKFWPTHTRVRQHFKVPSYDYFFYYPARTLYPKFQRWSWADTLDVRYWRHYRDPYYDQPLWFPYRPWVYESRDAEKAVDMFEKKLITYDALNRYWMNPYMHENKIGYTSYLQRPFFWPNYPRQNSHFYDTTVY